MASDIRHGEAGHHAALSGLAAQVWHFNPRYKADASFRDLEGPARNEQARAGGGFGQRRLGRFLAHEVIRP